MGDPESQAPPTPPIIERPLTAQIEVVPIESLSEDPANARLHPTRNLDALKASLRRFGQRRPVVIDKDNIIRAGNGLYRSAKELGWTKIGCVRASDLSATELEAYAIADNRTAELSDWDFQVLAGKFQALAKEGFDLTDTGWMPHEIEPLMQADWNPPAVAPLPATHGEVVNIAVTKAQKDIIDRAVATIRVTENDKDISIGRALELICADYLAGAEQTAQPEATAQAEPEATKSA